MDIVKCSLCEGTLKGADVVDLFGFKPCHAKCKDEKDRDTRRLRVIERNLKRERTQPRIEIVGTRTNKLRARITPVGGLRFEVTLGGDQWCNGAVVDAELGAAILARAQIYVNRLADCLKEAQRPAPWLRDD